MDILQARKKAREKAEQEAKASQHEAVGSARVPSAGVMRGPSPAAQAPAIKKSPSARAVEKKPKTKPKAKTPASVPTAPAKTSGARTDSKTFGARVTPPAHSAPETTAPQAPAEDVFLDMSFGEDLPTETMDAADFDLGPAGPKPSPKPPAPTPAQPATSQNSGARAAPQTSGARAVFQTLEVQPPSPTSRARAASDSLGARVPSPASSPPPRDLAVERLSSEKEDFLELVSEDLYRREFGEEAQVEDGEQLELISFRLAQETYAIRLTHVQQIIKLREITLVPRAPAYILGVISLRGMIIPIFDLRSRLGLASREATRQTRIIVVMEGPKVIGLIVDQVEHVVRIPAGAIEPPPPILGGLESEYLEGIGRFSGRMLILLNLSKVLAPPTTH